MVKMKNDEVVMIPFVQHESDMNRMERANRRLWIVILVMFIGMMIYFFLPTEETKEINTQDVEDVEDSEIHQNIGK